MPRRTKIVATLGPATDGKHVLDEMIQAGMDVVRVNFSHGTHEDHIKRAESVRNRARAHGHQVGVLADLQGPKIRIERFREGMIRLEKDDHFILDAGLDADAGSNERVGITLPAPRMCVIVRVRMDIRSECWLTCRAPRFVSNASGRG